MKLLSDADYRMLRANKKSLRILAGLTVDLVYHQRRHIFGTLLLSVSISIESIAKIMGHTNISTTQVYAEITNQKVRKDFGILLESTKDLYSIPEDNMPVRVYQCSRYSGWKTELNENNFNDKKLCNE